MRTWTECDEAIIARSDLPVKFAELTRLGIWENGRGRRQRLFVLDDTRYVACLEGVGFA